MAAPADSVSIPLTQLLDSKGEEEPIPLTAVKDVKSKFPLHEAAENGNKDEVLKILLGLHGQSEDARGKVINSIDGKGWAALHYAAYNNHWSVIETLLLNSADPDVRITQENSIEIGNVIVKKDSTPLHLAAAKGHVMGVKVLLDSRNQLQQHGSETSVDLKPAVVNAENVEKETSLQYASINDHVEIVIMLLECGAQEAINQADNNEFTPLHYAVSKGSVEIVRVLLENGAKESINHADNSSSTPLHYAVSKGSVEIARVLLENGAKESISHADNSSCTPLAYAITRGSVMMVTVLLENGAKESINHPMTFCGKQRWTPAHLACYYGHVEVVKILLAAAEDTAHLEKANDEGNTPLMVAIKEGYKDVVEAILMKFNHATTRKLLMVCNDNNSTPIREAIRKMPDFSCTDAAAKMLDCCTKTDVVLSNTDDNYSVHLYYSILEDFQDDDSSHSSVHQQDHQRVQSCVQKCVNKVFPKEGGFTTKWGPVGFHHESHPLNLIAQSEDLKLLKHPLVTYLLKRKWKVARFFYLIGLLFYCIFLAFLTAYALSAPSPLCGSCHAIIGALGNASFVDSCEQSDNRQQFIFTAAIFVVLLALARLIIEVFQMCQHKVHYFTDPVNWMELLMAVFAIIFAWVFNTDCLCTYHWQWQIGTIAVFLAWFDFTIFVQKLPTVGIYVAMLRDILWSFIKALPLAVLLVIAFSLGFFMLFSEPGILRSPFSTPARALLSIIAYTAGEIDYNGLFRLTFNGTGEDSDVEEIPFPPVSYILFVVFVIIMSILLSNLLTALAVGDTEKILQNAEATNIAQKIQLILSVDAILPAKLRRKFIVRDEKVYPNAPLFCNRDRDLFDSDTPRWKKWLRRKYREVHASVPKGIEISEVLKREDNSLKGLTKKVHDMKQTMEKRDDEKKMSQDELKQELKQSQEEIKQELKQSREELKALQDELKKSQEEIKKMIHELLQKLS